MGVIYNIKVDEETEKVFREFQMEIHNFLRTRNSSIVPCWSGGIYCTRENLSKTNAGFIRYLRAFNLYLSEYYEKQVFKKGTMSKLIQEVARNLGN